MTAGFGGVAAAHMLCTLFTDNPQLDYETIHISHGRVEVEVVGETGALMNWTRAVPHSATHTCLVPASYGCDEADVIEGDCIRVTVRRPSPWGHR